MERSTRQQSKSWLSRALHKKRERGSSNRDIPKFVVLDQPFVAETDALRFDDETTSFVSLKVAVPPERGPSVPQESPAPQVLDAPPADPEDQETDVQAVEGVPLVSPTSPESGERPVFSALLRQFAIQFDERSQCLEEKIGELDRLVAEGQQDGKEQFDRLDTTLCRLQTALTALQYEAKANHETVTAGVATLQAAAQAMQRSSAAIIEKLDTLAQAQTEELHAVRRAVGSRKNVWNGLLLITAAVGILSTLYCTVFAP